MEAGIQSVNQVVLSAGSENSLWADYFIVNDTRPVWKNEQITASNKKFSGEITLSWDGIISNVGIAQYRIYDQFGQEAEVLLETTTDTSATLTGLAMGTHMFRIEAVDRSGFVAQGGPFWIEAFAAVEDLPVPRATHPRLLLGPNDLDDIRSKMENSKTSQFADGLETLSAQTSGKLPARAENSDSNQNDNILQAIEAKALLYLLDKEANLTHGQQAIQMIKDYIDTLDHRPGADAYSTGIWSGNALYAGALVYDWCYDLLSENDKLGFIEQFEYLAGQLECGYPPELPSTVSGHQMEQCIQRDLLAAGIAIFNEDEEMYYLAADLFVNRVAPTANYLYQMGTNSQGTSYGQGKIKWNAIGNVLMEKMNDDGIKYINDGISQSMYSYIYYRRPDGQLVRMGDGFQSSASLGARWNFSDADAILYLNAQYPDPYLQQELLNCLNSGVTLNPTEALVLYDVNTEPKPISELPLTRYLDSPNSEMIARTGWSIDTVDFSANDMIVDMKIQELMLNNHNHLDSGSFQIYYKGSLAVDSGTYGLYGGSHDLNYHKRGIAHNSILIRDPNVQEGVYNFWGQELSNDGGMDWVGWGALPDDITGETAETLKTPETMDNRPWINGEVLAHQFGPDLQVPDYTYLKGDLTGFYGYRAEDFNRSFVFFNFMNDLYPGALIVFDKITATDASYDKYFLLHSINEPVVNGNTTTIQRTENGYNGQLINTTLLPGEGNVNIEVVEGYEVFGTTYPEPLNGPTDEGGEWRIQVSPVADAETDLMLNVMQVSDAGVTPLPVTQIGSAQDPLVGAKIYDRIALFSTSGEEIEGTVSIPQAAKAFSSTLSPI